MSAAQAQSITGRHDWTIREKPLEKVLIDLEEAYAVRFAYSRDYLPMQDPVSLTVGSATLEEVLPLLLDDRDILYRKSGNQVLLRVRSREIQKLAQRGPPQRVPQQSPIYADPRREELLAQKRKIWRQQIPVIQQRASGASMVRSPVKKTLDSLDYRRALLLQRGHTLDAIALTVLAPVPLQLEKPASRTDSEVSASALSLPYDTDALNNDRLAQISLLPYLGTNLLRSPSTINRVSLNLVWGTNGGVNGMEVGGLGNNILGNVQGIQVAGWLNTVSDNVVGSQIAGLANMVGGTAQGVQLAGLFNASGPADAVQMAGLFNTVNGDFLGIQVAGLFNVVGSDAQGMQFSPLFNVAAGNGRHQIAGFFNRAQDVSGVQISPFLNVADGALRGLQFGLINVADTVSTGIPIGLLNLVRKGYNRLELAASETFFGNISLKIGVRKFYNIFYVGVRSEDQREEVGDYSRVTSWGLGYGLGTALPLGRRFHLNVEAVSIHVNERENWTTTLNQLNQLRVLFEGRIGNRISLVAGPVGNLMVSRLDHEADAQIGTQLAPYTLYDETRNGTNTKVWIGALAGIRF